MSLGNAITGRLSTLRAGAESIMTNTCTIARAGAPTFNTGTGNYSASSTTVYTGKCRVRPRSAFLRDRVAQAGEHAEHLWPYIVTIPVSAVNVEVGDVLTVTTSGDPTLVGRALVIRIAARGEHITARRLDCEEVAS